LRRGDIAGAPGCVLEFSVENADQVPRTRKPTERAA
jgi:hypothetical protein